MMQGKIERAQRSKSGKSLRILVNDQWYSTDNWALEQAIGRTVQFNVGTSEYMGNTVFWANDAELVIGHNEPMASAPAPNVPAASPQPQPQSPTGTGRERDASIIAQALTKAVTSPGDDIGMVWNTYCAFYFKALAGEKQPASQGHQATAPEFDDDIPF